MNFDDILKIDHIGIDYEDMQTSIEATRMDPNLRRKRENLYKREIWFRWERQSRGAHQDLQEAINTLVEITLLCLLVLIEPQNLRKIPYN